MKKYFSKAIFAFLFALFATNILLILPQISNARGYENEEQLARIQETIKNQKKRWTAAHNPISDLPDEEKKNLLLPVSQIEKLESENLENPSQLQNQEVLYQTSITALDWRNNNGNFVTPVKDQDSCGSCWAFASTAGLESAILISKNKTYSQFPIDLSEQHLISCGGSGSCRGGSPDRAGTYFSYYGLPPESCFPYSGTDQNCSKTCSDWQSLALPYKIYATPPTGWDIETYKNVINQYGPILANMLVYYDFFYYGSGIYSRTSNIIVGGHSILLVGYDDFEQYFIAKNSWGPNWGEKGFFRIAYSEIGKEKIISSGSAYLATKVPWPPSSPSPTPTPPPDPNQPLKLTSPNGGEEWEMGSLQKITWNYTTNFTGGIIRINLLRDDISVLEIVPDAPKGLNNSGFYAWRIPKTLTPGNNYKIKITNGVYDISDNNFTLKAAPGPSITVTSPNGGEQWETGNTYTINWSYTADPGNYVKIQLLQNESVLSTIASAVAKGTGNQGSYIWRIPATLSRGNNYKIKITSNSNENYTDASNAAFALSAPPGPSITVTSPNGGEQWKTGDDYTINWTYTSNPGSYVKIQLLKNNILFSTIASSATKGTENKGSYNWKIPTTLSPADNYKIKVTSTSNASYTDSSDSSFALTGPPPPSVTLVSPNGGEQWEIGNSQVINWTFTQDPGPSVKIQLMLNDSVVSTITTATPKGAGNQGSYFWKIPTTLTPSANYRIKITSISNQAYSDTSNNGFSLKLPPTPLKLTSPNGGEVLKTGTKQTITWEYTNSAIYYLKIDLYKNGARNRTIGYVNPTKRTATWTVSASQLEGSDYKIRISNYSGILFFDESDGYFTITK